jgi:acetyltransferase-like isoleucine patch superfamily enzyme
MTAPDRRTELSEQESIRHRLYGGGGSAARRYADLVVGRDGSMWDLLRHEAITTLFGHLPGALGLVARRAFYPGLLRACGRRVVFGRALTIRNGQNIRLGDGVVLDDLVLLDGRGAGDEGLVLGDRVVVNRGAALQAKVGPLHVGAETDIGSGVVVTSQGGTFIGRGVDIAAGCMIGGGRRDLSGAGGGRYSAGPVRLEDGVALGRGVIVMDGVVVGRDSLIGAGVVLREPVPPDSVVTPRESPIVMPRGAFGGPAAAPGARRTDTRAGSRPATPAAAASPGPATMPNGPESTGADEGEGDAVDASAIDALLARAVERMNEELPPARRIASDPEQALPEPGGPLDSLRLVRFVLIVQEEVEGALGAQVSLADVDPFEGAAPFSSLGRLAAHLRRLLAAAPTPVPPGDRSSRSD